MAAGSFGKILVDREKERPERSVERRCVVHLKYSGMSGILTEYSPRRARSSDQPPRGDFSYLPQRPCSDRGKFTSIMLRTHTAGAVAAACAAGNSLRHR